MINKYLTALATLRCLLLFNFLSCGIAGVVVHCAFPGGRLVAQDDIERIPNPFDDNDTTFADPFGDATASPSERADKSQTPRAARSGERIELQASFRKAVELARLEQRPVLAVFGADWCSWCRKLEGELETKDADAILKRWIVVKVDVDDDPALAEQLGVGALPGLRVLGKDQTAIASREGYLPLVELEAWLAEHLATADPTIQRVLYASGKLDADALQQLKEFLGNRAPDLRVAAQERLSNGRTDSAGFVVDTLRTGSLAQRLSAIDILRRWKAPVESLDPWRPETISSDAVDPLLEWLRSEDAAAQPNEGEAEISELNAVDPTLVAELMRELLNDAVSDRQPILARAAQLGMALVPDLRLRLADSDALSDQQRAALRELLYRILVGPRVRLEQTTLLTALASGDMETHRQAASAILDSLTSQDQPLADELSTDSDPLVRELAVAKLQRLGALQEPQRLQRLLADNSPSVRTAVLRQLAEKPDEKSIETLINYLGEETDEDLLVYATKTLGQLGSTGKAESALIGLAGNAGWRIRAAALDAITERLSQSNGYVFSFARDSEQSKVSGPLAEAILKSMEDGDPFVAEKAVALFPQIISKDSAPSLLSYLQTHPQRLATIDAEISEYQKEELFLPLVEHARSLLKGAATEQVPIAASIVAKLAPTKLRDVLPQLLGSPESSTRISGINGLLASLREMRITEIEARNQANSMARRKWSEMQPWHSVPESFNVLPKAKKGLRESKASTKNSAGATSDSDRAKGSDEGEVAALDDFFGTAPDTANLETQAGIEAALAQDTDASEVATSNEELDLVDELFGELPSPAARKPANVEPANVEPKPSRPENSLPSVWLAEWYSADANATRPKWIRGCIEILDARLQTLTAETDDAPAEAIRQNEIQWLRLGLLASGDLEQATAIDSSMLNDLERNGWLVNALPWLPEAERLELLREAKIDFVVWKEPAIQEILQAATEIDSRVILAWLVQEYSALEERSANDLSLISDLVMRALYGTLIENRSTTFSTGELKSGDEPFTDFDPSTGPLPDHEQTVESLRELYTGSNDPFVQSAVLNALSRIDHRLATQTAVGRIASAEKYDAVVQVSLAIALADQIAASCDRAVQFLGHSLPDVRRAAMERLASTSYDFFQERAQLGAALIYDYEEQFPGLWYIRRDVEPAAIASELDDGNSELRWIAKALELMSDRSNSEVLDELVSSDEKQRTLVIAALTKAERTDAAALDYYRKSIDNLESPEVIYAMLRGLRGNEIQAVRNQMRRQYGSSALQ